MNLTKRLESFLAHLRLCSRAFTGVLVQSFPLLLASPMQELAAEQVHRTRDKNALRADWCAHTCGLYEGLALSVHEFGVAQRAFVKRHKRRLQSFLQHEEQHLVPRS